MKNFTFEQICFVTIVNLHVQYFREFNSPSRKILKFDFLPYSAFIFGGRNQRPKAENLRFWPKISASGIPLVGLNDFTPNEFENIYIPGQELWNR